MTVSNENNENKQYTFPQYIFINSDTKARDLTF